LTVRPRIPGDPFRVKASEWNTIARVVNAADLNQLYDGTGRYRLPAGVVLVRNDTGAAVTRYQPLRITGAILDPSEQSEQYLSAPALVGGLVDQGDLLPGTFVIAIEQIPDGGIGRAAAYGVHAIKAQVISESDGALRVAYGESLLQSSADGPVDIIHYEPGTGVRHMIIGLFPVSRLQASQIEARITSSTPMSGQANRWVYEWEEVAWADNDPQTVTDGRNSTTDGVALNRLEASNTATGIQGNGIDADGLPTGFELVPIGSGACVRLTGPYTNATTGLPFWLFEAPNAVDGDCQ